jgi:rhamnosyltransferase
MSAAGSLNVLAVVVSYNGGKKTVETVRHLRAQVSHVHVVDNGSSEPSRQLLEDLAREGLIVTTFLGENRGIAAALNVGVEAARANAHEWLLTMDQDSTIAPGFIAAYVEELAARPDASCLVPNVLTHGVDAAADEGPVEFAITSGTLLRNAVCDSVGKFEEPLFIDGVDIDYCLRMRLRGFEIRRVRNAKIVHELGDRLAVPHWLARVYASHSPLRRYYMYRNHLYLVKTYGLRFPWFMFKGTIYQLLLLILIAFYDAEPIRSYAFIFRGLRDFFGGRMGAFREVV